MPIESDSNLNDTAFAFWFQTVDRKDVLDVECVAVGDVPRSIDAGDAYVSRTILYDSVSFHRWCRLDESAINFEFSFDDSRLVHSFSFKGFFISCLRLLPSCSGYIQSALAYIELI